MRLSTDSVKYVALKIHADLMSTLKGATYRAVSSSTYTAKQPTVGRPFMGDTASNAKTNVDPEGATYRTIILLKAVTQGLRLTNIPRAFINSTSGNSANNTWRACIQ